MVSPAQFVILTIAFSLPVAAIAADPALPVIDSTVETPTEQPDSPPIRRATRRRTVSAKIDNQGRIIPSSVREITPRTAIRPVAAQIAHSADAENPDLSDSGPTQIVPPAPDDEYKSILRKPLRAFPERHISLPPAGEIDFAPRMITCYKPLYFEDANLERYGYSRGGCLQPVVSGVHFFGSVGLAPLKMLGVGPCQTVCPFPDADDGYRLRPARNLFGPTPRYDRVFGPASGSTE